MVIRTGFYWIVLATAGTVAATGLWLLVFSGSLTPAEQAAADENSKAWHAADLLCLKHYEAKWAWKRGTGRSQAEVERLAAELIAARAGRTGSSSIRADCQSQPGRAARGPQPGLALLPRCRSVGASRRRRSARCRPLFGRAITHPLEHKATEKTVKNFSLLYVPSGSRSSRSKSAAKTSASSADQRREPSAGSL